VSKKSQQRRNVSGNPRGMSTAQLGTAVDGVFEKMLADLFSALRAGDVLAAEVATARCLAIGHSLGADQDRSDNIFVRLATQSGKPEDAALLRVITQLGSPAVKRSAGRALADLTASGVYPAGWVAEVGRPVPVQAWRRFDAFGDEEVIAVTYRYGETSTERDEQQGSHEHALLVHIALTGLPVINEIGLATDTTDLAEELNRPSSGFIGCAEIPLADARRRLDLALSYTTLERKLSDDTITFLPIVRSRLRRLPAPADSGEKVYTAADRAASVEEFMRSPEAVEAVAADQASTRFWAEALTAYSSRRTDEPPGEVGPRKLRNMLAGFVAPTYALTEAQRRHARPAVTAWVRWSAASRGLDDAATRQLTGAIPAALDDFEAVYDDPAIAEQRAYAADLAVREAGIQGIGAHLLRRQFAIPRSRKREYGGNLDVADPAGRRAYAVAEFGGCAVPEGASPEDSLAAVHRVIEELWTGEPPVTWERAQRLKAAGMDRHDIIHDLAERPAAGARPRQRRS
jgi:hypothetical protein